MVLLVLTGRPQPLKNHLQSQKGNFSEKKNYDKETKNSRPRDICEGNLEYICRCLDKKLIFKLAKLALNHAKAAKNKA